MIPMVFAILRYRRKPSVWRGLTVIAMTLLSGYVAFWDFMLVYVVGFLTGGVVK